MAPITGMGGAQWAQIDPEEESSGKYCVACWGRILSNKLSRLLLWLQFRRSRNPAAVQPLNCCPQTHTAAHSAY